MSYHNCGHCGNCGNHGTRNIALPYVNGEEDMYYPSEACVPYVKAGTMFSYTNSPKLVSVGETTAYQTDQYGRKIPIVTRKVTLANYNPGESLTTE
ncbi:hypothetical protein NFI96_015047 [Prochilodus magdalenae]|nr:hypothetical protein NFI96_015047 [Prochilodus magdalenae]